MKTLFQILSLLAFLVASAGAANAQQPVLAKPTATQLEFQDLEVGLFLHFGINTYDPPNQRGFGKTPAAAFNPTELNCDQWMQTAKALGAKYAILTARHEDGFCLWPSKTSDYTVAQSPYKGGKGDIVREFVDACRRAGIKPCLYTPPYYDAHYTFAPDAKVSWREVFDNLNNAKMSDPAFYAKARQRAIDQLTELLTHYGPIYYVWMDHWGIERPNSQDFWKAMTDTINTLQPQALVFGPDVEHGGNERGRIAYPMWNATDTLDGTRYTWGKTYIWDRDNTGTPLGKFWRPRELPISADFTNGWWFWSGPRRVLSLERRLDLYYRTVGKGANVIINLPPDRRGLIEDNIVAGAAEFRQELDRRFSKPLAETKGTGDTHELKFDAPKSIDHVILMEDIADGQKVARYVVEVRDGQGWKTVVEGSTIGHKKIDRFEPVTAEAIRFRCVESVAQPVKLRRVAAFDTR